MKTIMDKLANQLNSKEKAIAAVDVIGQASPHVIGDTVYSVAAAALELAAPVTGLPIGVGMAGVKKCFDEWLEANGAGKHEDRRIIEQAEDFIAQHALGTRFMEWSDKSTNKDHAGYRKQEGEKLELWVIRRVFADEIAQSFDEAKVCRVLADNGLLKYNHKNRGYQHQRKQRQTRDK